MYPNSQSALGLHPSLTGAGAPIGGGGLPPVTAQSQAAAAAAAAAAAVSAMYTGVAPGSLLTSVAAAAAADNRLAAAYNWGAPIGLSASVGSLFADQQSSKIVPDTPEKRSPSLQSSRMAHHTSGGSVSTRVSDSPATSVSRLQPFRASGSTDLLAGSSHSALSGSHSALTSGSHSALAGSQFPSYDSMYKAYQGAFSQGAAGPPPGLFGPQSMRFEDQLLTEQQLMLQASLLQYPHFGVFPGVAAAAAAAAGGLYPGLTASAAGIRFPPADFYGAAAAAAQSVPPGLLMGMKPPNINAVNWLGLDRMQAIPSSMASDRDAKDRVGIGNAGNMSAKEPSDRRMTTDRRDDTASSVRRDEPCRRDDPAGRRDPGRRSAAEMDATAQLRRERKHSGSHHHHHHHHQSPAKDDASRHTRHASDNHQHPVNSHNQAPEAAVSSKHRVAVTPKSDQQQQPQQPVHLPGNIGGVGGVAAGIGLFGMPTGSGSEPLNLNKLTSPAAVAAALAGHAGVGAGGRFDGSWDQQFNSQQFLSDHDRASRDGRRPSTNRNDTDAVVTVPASTADKMQPLTLTIPPRSAVGHVGGTTKATAQPPHAEQKFHRPFELPTRPDTSASTHRPKTAEKVTPQPVITSGGGGGPSDTQVFAPAGRTVLDRNGDAIEIQRRQQQQQQQQQLAAAMALGRDIKLAMSNAGSAAPAVDVDAPLNLVVGRHVSTVARPQTTVGVVGDVGGMPPIVDGDRVTTGDNSRRRSKAEPAVHRRPVLSLLDRRAAARMERQKRLAKVTAAGGTVGVCCSSDEDDDEIEDDDAVDEKTVARLLILTSGLPLKPDNSPRKRKFLKEFGLVASHISAEVEFEKRRKRRRLFREPSVSPTIVDDTRDSSRSVPVLTLTLSQQQPGMLRCAESPVASAIDLQYKALFLYHLGLQPLDTHLKRKLDVSHCQSDLEKRRLLDGLTNHVTKSRTTPATGYHTESLPNRTLASSGHRSPRHQTFQEMTAACGDDRGPSTAGLVDGLLSRLAGRNAATVDGQHLVDLSGGDSLNRQSANAYSTMHSGRPTVALDLTPTAGSNLNNSLVDFSSPPPSAFCLHGFESSTPACPLSAAGRATGRTDLAAGDGLTPRDGSGGGSRKTFQWPGIDAVMESYQLHLEEQAMEKQLLVEQCQRLKLRNAELTRVAERLAAQMSDLLHGKQQAGDERVRIQAALDNLKCCLKR